MFLYTSLEDKWYALLDKIDSKLPVYKIIDPIDRIVPSFLVFLIIFLLLFFYLFSFFIFGTYSLEILVVDSGGFPVKNASAYIDQQYYLTDESGKILFSTGQDFVFIEVEKDGFSSQSKEVDLLKENKVIISLSPEISSNRSVSVIIENDDGEIIEGASLEFKCDFQSFNYNNQDLNAFEINFNKDCSSKQLIARADGYKEKTSVLGDFDERVIIRLEEESYKGEILFSTFSGSSGVSTQITVRDNFGFSESFTSSSFGEIKKEFEVGNYFYIAELNGDFKEGAFEVKSNLLDVVEIEFNEFLQEDISNLDEEEKKYVYLKVVDESDNVLQGTKITLFIDGTRMSPLVLGVDGEYKKYISSLHEEKDFFVLLENPGFERKILKVETRYLSSGPQEIVLEEGGAIINLSVVDDEGKNEEDAKIVLTNKDFSIDLFLGKTDNNGRAIIKNLPEGEYSLLVVDEHNKDEANEEFSLSSGQIKDLDLILRIGRGKINFNFNDVYGNRVSSKVDIFKKERILNLDLLDSTMSNEGIDFFESDWNKIYSETQNKFYVMSPEEKSGDILKAQVTDSNYFPMESFPYLVERGTKSKDLFLIKENDLPNNNSVQMILTQILTDNPITTNASSPRAIEDNKEYYLFFNIILNNENNDSLIANIFLDSNDGKPDKIFIDDLISVDGYSSKLSTDDTDFQIENSLVDSRASYSNLLLSEQEGKKIIPVLVKLSIDENASGQFVIKFKAKHGSEESLAYEKEFFINERFCLGNDCPSFLFTNKLKHGQEEKLIDARETQLIYNDEIYSIVTSIKNLSDKQFNNISLEQSIKERFLDFVSFGNDSNIKLHNFDLLPLSKTSDFETGIELKDNARIAIEEKLLQNGIEMDSFKDSSNEIKLLIDDKEELLIDVSPDNLDKGAIYNLLIKTRFKSSYKGIPASFEILHEGQQIASGQTDGNGLAQLKIDFGESGFDLEDEIIFRAFVPEGAIAGEKIIKLSSSLPIEEEVLESCIDIKVNGLSINENNVVTTNKGEEVSFEFISNCSSDEKISFATDLERTDSIIELGAGQSKTTILIAEPRGDLLGVYPVQIMSLNETSFKQIAFMDIVIKDPSSEFDLEQAIFDLRETDKISSKVTNNYYEGRKDNFYPQMKILTNSVTLEHTKPGLPEVYKFTIHVWGKAYEGFTSSLTKSDSARFKIHGNYLSGKKYDHYPIFVDDLYFTGTVDDAIDYLNKALDAKPLDRTEPDIPETDPRKSFYDLPEEAQIKIISDLHPEEGSVNRDDWGEEESVEAQEKEGKISLDLLVQGVAAVVGAVETRDELKSDSKINNVSDLTEGGTWIADESLAGQCAGESSVRSTEMGTNPEEGETLGSSLINIELPTGENVIEGQIYPPFGGMTNYCENIKMSPVYGCLIPPQYPARNVGGGNFEFFYSSAHDIYANSADKLESVPGFSELISKDECVPIHKFSKTQYVFTSVSGDTPFVRSFGYAGGGDDGDCTGPRIYGSFMIDDGSGGLFGGGYDGHIEFQTDAVNGSNVYLPRIKKWSKDFNIVPIEGKVYDLGSYDAAPVPELMDIDKLSGREAGDSWQGEKNFSYYTVPALGPLGFVPFNHLKKARCSYGKEYPDIPNHNNPRIEYDPSGYIAYELPPWLIPDDLRVFLKNGHVYAEYIGNTEWGWPDDGTDMMAIKYTEPDVTTPIIDFNLTKNNLLGKEYAILVVRDWVRKDGKLQKVEKAFQIKLIGQKHNCFLDDGTEGFTGKEFSPKLLFNWGWENISLDQCDLSNNYYTYCDGTQFTISLVKKIEEIELLLNQNRFTRVPEKTSFYSYLIKDSYSDSFLNDFEEYFSNTFAESPSSFTQKFNKFFKENKISFNIEGGEMPYGGLYQVSLDLEIDNSTNSLFAQEEANTEIIVNLRPISKAKNYNLLYEMPFDGKIGSDRGDYGIGVNAELQLNDDFKFSKNADKEFQVNTDISVSELNKKVLLRINENEIKFYPSQATPVLMTIDTNTGRAKAEYSIAGTENISKKWELLASNLGKKDECVDFKNSNSQTFTNNVQEDGKALIDWSDGYKPGKIVLGTLFFTPQKSNNLVLKPENRYTSFSSFADLENSGNIFLNYFDFQNDYSYTNIGGLFDLLEDEKVCMSKNSEEELILWWNKEYLDKLLYQVARNERAYGCN
jgi:hypothetical protein